MRKTNVVSPFMLCASIHFVVIAVGSRMYGSTPILILCFRFCCHLGIHHSHSAQVDSQLYSATPLGDKAATFMTPFSSQSYYPNTVLTHRCPILVMSNASLGSDNHPYYKSLVWRNQNLNSQHSAQEVCTLSNRPLLEASLSQDYCLICMHTKERDMLTESSIVQ